MRILAALTFILALYSAIGVTYMLVSDFVDSENTRITELCENQKMMSPLDCYKQH
ncbi:exported hypothetical protein [Vibrio nigripulchritudo SOn1]|uniref:TMhelix containing protein n=1 Tax=Vibrio nigripulchritudo SOn1 TaxID=1238450 RepID=A0AAV2VHM1_9VIBR|nr:hypothetical protein [Vibrio nigripulchritudo]CCO44195.1 exported hypothetical protein [Vibrio nigripulchritudo SOn1]